MVLINSFSSVIKVPRSKKSLSIFFFRFECIYCTYCFCFNFQFNVFIHPQKIFIINSYILIGHVITENIQYSFVNNCDLFFNIFLLKSLSQFTEYAGFPNCFWICLFVILYKTLVWWGRRGGGGGQEMLKLNLVCTILWWQIGCKDARTPEFTDSIELINEN